MNLQKVISEAKTVEANSFLDLTKKAINALNREPKHAGNVTVTGKLAKIRPVGEALVIGDLHGDLTSLIAILRKSRFLKKMSAGKDAVLVFLGDYGDRGPQSPELYYVVLSLKLAFPEQVVLLRGNHEGPSSLMPSPHDLPMQLHRRFKQEWVPIYTKLGELFECLCNAAYVPRRYLMVHGGLPVNLRSLKALSEADADSPLLEELLWNDPNEEIAGVLPSPRGAGSLFGKNITQRVLKKISVPIVIRGHEPAQEGYKINHDGKILTLFSRKGIPYLNPCGAYLQVPLAEKFENAQQLLSYVHKF
jgi:protein phosphatase